MFAALAESPSFVASASTTGLPFRRCPFAAIVTGPSVMPLASFASVLPVQGAMTSASIAPCGPRGSASTIFRTARRPATASTRVTKSSAVPKRVEYFAAFSDRIGTISCSRAMSS